MSRTLVRPAFLVCLLPLMLFLSACARTQRLSVLALTLCIGGIPANVAIMLGTGTPGAPGRLLGLFLCKAGDAALRSAPTLPAAELPRRDESQEVALTYHDHIPEMC